jgi:hypothetical protein
MACSNAHAMPRRHADRLEWLGLDAPGQFDPAEFDISEASQALSSPRPGAEALTRLA